MINHKLYFLTAFTLITKLAFTQENISNKIINNLKNKTELSNINPHNHRRCISSTLLEAKRNWNILSDAAKSEASRYLSRPILTDEQIYYSDYFDIHYTLSGNDAVDLTDDNINSVPDYVETMGSIFDYVYLQFTTTLGYTEPPKDGLVGGSDFYDIYIHDIGLGLYGFVAPENNITDNPQSPLIEYSSMTSYMGMNNDYSWAGSGSLQSMIDAVKVTAAHEFFHSIQFGYSSERTNFIFESTAAWIEDVIYPGIDDNLQYLPIMFKIPDVSLSLNDEDSDAYGSHWYGGWLFFKYLQERYSSDIVRDIWGRCIGMTEMEAVSSSIFVRGGDFDETFASYLIANGFLTNNSAFSPYVYSRGDVYSDYLANNNCDLYFEGSLSSNNGSWNSAVDGNGRLQRLSADYIIIDHQSNQDFKVTLNSNNVEVDIMLVKLNSSTSGFNIQQSVQNGQALEINVADQEMYDTFIAIVGRLDKNVLDTISSQYTLNISSTITSTNEIASRPKVEIFPNPSNNVLNINYNNKEHPVNHFKIVDVAGKDFMSGELHSNKSISVSSLESGLYQIYFYDENKIIINKQKLIIQH